MLRQFRLRSTIIPTSSSSCVLSLFPSPSSFHRRDLHIETKVFSPSGIEWVSITSSEDLSEIVKEVSPPITKDKNKNTNNDASDKNIKSGHDDIKSKNEEKSSSTTKNSENNSNDSTSSSDNTNDKSKSSEKTTTTTTTSISKSESNSSYASSEFIKENKHMKKQFEFESMFHSHHFYGQEQNSPEHVEAKKKKQQKKPATKSSNNKKDDTNDEEIHETETKNKSSDDENKTTTTSEKNEAGKQSETKETEDKNNKNKNKDENNSSNKEKKKPSSTSSPSFNYGRHDAPSCPVRRSDYEFQTELAFALRQLNVPDYFIFRMRKRIPLPLIMYHPLADDSTAGCVFVCRYFQHHRIASGERELSESEMLTQMKKNVARRQHEATKRRRLWYRNPVLSRIAETLDSSHVISRTCYNLSRRAYWRWLKMKILRNAPPLTDNSNDTTSNENDNNDTTKDTIKQGDSSKKKDEPTKPNKSTKKKEENDKNNKIDNKQASSSSSYLFGDVDTIESSTHRLTIIVQPERIITVSRFPINFISEMERSFDRLNRHEPPMHFICSLVSQCSATFEKAARTELRFVDHLESIFFEQQTERERTDTYKMMLYQLHKVSRRASISANILPQMISAFTELCAALQHSQQQQQQQQLAVIRGAEETYRNSNDGEEDNVDDEASSSTADEQQVEEDQALTPQQIIASNRQVLNCISHMRNALALHADVYESCRVVMALFFQESANELEKLTRTLTVFSTLFIPMSFMTTLFSADFEVFKPLYSSVSYFWLTLAGIFVVGLSTNAWLIATGVLRR